MTTLYAHTLSPVFPKQSSYISEVTASPIVKITYQAHEGYVCTEGFTFQDAQVLCRQQGFMYGTYFKASATGEHSAI